MAQAAGKARALGLRRNVSVGVFLAGRAAGKRFGNRRKQPRRRPVFAGCLRPFPVGALPLFLGLGPV